MKKTIVFGATGQLGCYSALALKENGYDVVAVGRRISDGGFFGTKGIQFVGGFDIAKKESFELLPNHKYDVVVNMAGTMPAHADMNMMPYVQSIVVGTVNLCNWMKSNGTKRIVFNTTPSDVAEHWDSIEPIDDDASRSFPKNGNDHAVYAICKRAACDILEHEQIADGFEPCIFRHFMVYGWHPDAYYYLNGEKRMLPWRYMIRRCINGQGIDVYGDPSRLKELLYIKDFADAIVRAAETNVCGIFNLPGYKPYSLDEMVDGIMNTFASEDAVKKYRPDMPDTPQILLSGKKSEEILGWKPKWTWEAACRDMKEECQSNPIELMWGAIENEDTIK
ncbi:NAD(P)-dependent oxidoreductase [Parabacteroides distasonis]|jgi:nucleoside-diphosphate-sugar epimerase|nr:NAD(P)-dependent oxidoreductase [Parabacteroides distasonis]